MQDGHQTSKSISAITNAYTKGFEHDPWIRRLKVLGIIMGLMFAIGSVVGRAQGQSNWIDVVGAVGFFGSLLVAIAAAARGQGLRRGTKNFGGQIWYVLVRTFLYVLLPCLLVAIIITIIGFYAIR